MLQARATINVKSHAVIKTVLLQMAVFTCLIPFAFSESTSNNDQVISSATELIKSGQYDAAINKVNDIIANHPSDAKAYLIRARALKYKKEYTKALDNCVQASIVDPNLADVYIERIDCCKKLLDSYGHGRYISASDALSPKELEALKFRSSLPRVLQRVGSFDTLRSNMRELDKQIPAQREEQTQCEPVIKKTAKEKLQDKFYPSAEFWYTSLYSAIHDDKSNQHIDATRKILFALGQLDEVYARHAKALDYYSKALAIEAKDPRAAYTSIYISRAIAFDRLEKYSQSIAEYTKALDLNKNRTGFSYVDRGLAYVNRGLSYFELGQYQNAIDNYNAAIRIGLLAEDSAGVPYYYRGKSYQKLGNVKAAEKDLQKAMELGYTLPDS